MKNTIFILTLLTLVSCSVSVRVPGNRFHTPETNGKKKVNASLGRAGMGKVELTEDYTRYYVSTKDAKLSYSQSLHGEFSYGASDNVDVGLFYNSDSSLSLFGKGNLLSGDWGGGQKYYLSGVVSGGISSEEKEADGNSFNSNDARVSINFFTLDAGLLIGSRVSESFLYYAGLYYLNMSFDSEHKIGSKTKDKKGYITAPTATYGFEWSLGKSLSLTAEGAYSKLGVGDDEKKFISNQQTRGIHSWGVRLNIF